MYVSVMTPLPVVRINAAPCNDVVVFTVRKYLMRPGSCPELSLA
jgi:hypothetical protein